jgi:hypothetical protein
MELVQVNLVNSGSSSLRRLKIPFNLSEQVVRKESAIYKSGSKARGRTASSFLVIQARPGIYRPTAGCGKGGCFATLEIAPRFPLSHSPYCCG